MAGSKYSISDLEQLTGIKAHTLRIWEKRYGILKPKRTPTNIRYYTDEDLKKLLNICILQRHGYRISTIAALENGDLGEKILSITSKSVDSDSNIENLIIAMIELDEARFEKILSNLILNLGFEETLLRVIMPFFEKVGLLWQVGTINPAQEHFITNLVRQKIIVAIDSLIKSASQPNRKTFLLYLPDGELHELGLLFYSYLIQKKGHRVIYLGQMLPFEDLIEVAQTHKPDVFLTIFTANVANLDIEEHLRQLYIKFPQSRIMTGGLQFRLNQIKLPPNAILLNSIETFKQELQRLEST